MSTERDNSAHTTIIRFVRSILAIFVSVTLPDIGYTPVVSHATPELALRAVSYAGALIRGHDEVVRTGAGISLAARCDEAQV